MPRESLDSARDRLLSIETISKILFIHAELVEACRGRDSNSHTFWAYAPQAYASASSATAARAEYIIYILYIYVKEKLEEFFKFHAARGLVEDNIIGFYQFL